MKRDRQLVAGIEFSIVEPANIQSQSTILFMHGIGGDDTSFENQTTALADQYRVIAWNMPGYRGSLPRSPLSFEVLAQALLALLDALDIKSAHIAGQSIGGMVAQEFYYRAAPRVESLILIATTSAFGGKDDSFRDAFLSARLKPLDNGMSMPQLAGQAIPAVTGSNISGYCLQGAIDAMSRLSDAVYRDALQCLVTFNRREEFSTIRCPVCLIAGAEDNNAPAATMAKMAMQLDNAEYHEISGAGHLVNSECPDECNRIIRAFLKSNIGHDN